MSDTTNYIDYINRDSSSGSMGQSPPRITLSIPTQTTVNALCPHNYANPYTYNIRSYMIYIIYVLLLFKIEAWGGDDLKCWGSGGDLIFGWRAYTKCA